MGRIGPFVAGLIGSPTISLHHGDTVYLTPQPDRIHRDDQGLRVA